MIAILTAPARDHPRINRVHNLLAVRVPDDYLDDFHSRPSSVQEALLAQLSSGIVEALPPAVCASLLESAPVEPPTSLYPILVALARRSDQPVPAGLHLEHADDQVIRDLLDIAPDLLTTERLAAWLSALLTDLRMQTKDALAGTVGFGGPSVAGYVALGIVGVPRGDPSAPVVSEAVNLLVGTADDERLPDQQRLDALIGLGHVHREGLISADSVPRLELPSSTSPMPPIGDAGPDHLRAALLTVRAGGWTDDDIATALALSRSSSESVRYLIGDAVGLAATLQPSRDIESLLLGMLFDPSDGVVESALRHIGRVRFTFPGAEQVLRSHLQQLFERGRSGLRTGVVTVALSQLESFDDAALRRIVETARDDASWQVRHAAAGNFA